MARPSMPQRPRVDRVDHLILVLVGLVWLSQYALASTDVVLSGYAKFVCGGVGGLAALYLSILRGLNQGPPRAPAGGA